MKRAVLILIVISALLAGKEVTGQTTNNAKMKSFIDEKNDPGRKDRPVEFTW